MNHFPALRFVFLATIGNGGATVPSRFVYLMKELSLGKSGTNMNFITMMANGFHG